MTPDKWDETSSLHLQISSHLEDICNISTFYNHIIDAEDLSVDFARYIYQNAGNR